MGTAYISNYDDYTTFSYGDRTLTFLTGKTLQRYERVKEWDKGYIVVDCLNKDGSVIEDYIDLIPILKNMYFDENEFLKNINEVHLKYV